MSKKIKNAEAALKNANDQLAQADGAAEIAAAEAAVDEAVNELNAAADAAAPHTETVEEFVARGGEIEPATKTDAPKQKGKRGKKELDLNDPFMKQTIQLCQIGNPKRKGSKSFARFELYQNGMTVAEFIKAGGTRGDINWDVEHEHIELTPAAKAE